MYSCEEVEESWNSWLSRREEAGVGLLVLIGYRVCSPTPSLTSRERERESPIRRKSIHVAASSALDCLTCFGAPEKMACAQYDH